ncbi:mitogen-activated protein kinase kinase 5-like [Chenopodium quinoa]|uniref:mitogen-activated protein kinase kinase 5-like n=1 Tax=Chenopodium quinoa TaxID=63459 RepID=UPI000B77261C|nr:mitogen-activated protein kinase kinase 5-like [Chenopodium quinoa]
MRDVVSGVAHFHEITLIHQDLKPQNVLTIKDKNFRAKLSDMGISKRLPEDMSSITQNGITVYFVCIYICVVNFSFVDVCGMLAQSLTRSSANRVFLYSHFVFIITLLPSLMPFFIEAAPGSA